MGTFNYIRQPYITLAINCDYDMDSLRSDADFMEWVAENYGDGDYAFNDAVKDHMRDCTDADYDNARYVLDKFSSRFFKLDVTGGYYEGVQLTIETDFDFDTYADKREAQKDVTQLKKVLDDLAGCGYMATVPFWCSTWYDYSETLNKIKEAVSEMRDDIKETKTWYSLTHRKSA